MSLFATKPLKQILSEANASDGHTLKQSLGGTQLEALGIGAVIGAGIFTLTGHAAANYAGPAAVLSFVAAAIACALAALCYSYWAKEVVAR